MRSTGNDIVDLSQIDPQRSIQYRFYSKFLSAGEEKVYANAGCPGLSFEQFVWLAWSIKESAYKYLQRHSPNLVFSPVRFVITRLDPPVVTAYQPIDQQPDPDGFYTGSVLAEGAKYFFSAFVTSELISTVVSNDPGFPQMNWAVRRIGNTSQATQSAAVRELLLGNLKEVFPGADLSVEKTAAGYPVIVKDNQVLDIPVSFSHHHSFVAYSILLQ